MAATWDSAYLLSALNRKAQRPATADAITDASKYLRLTESQSRIVAMIAARFPHVLYPTVAYGSIPTMTTVDNQVFTFGTDSNGYAIAPIGKTQIYRALADIPTYPMRIGRDYLPEGGTAIRIPNNNTYGSTLYWRGIQQPADIDATHQPALFPEASRELIVIEAVRQFAMEGGRNPGLYQLMAGEWATAWPEWCVTWRTAYRNGGALSAGISGLQLAIAGQ